VCLPHSPKTYPRAISADSSTSLRGRPVLSLASRSVHSLPPAPHHSSSPLPLVSFQSLTNCKFRNSFVLTSMQNARGVHAHSSSSRVPYTLPSSVYPKSFVCHSYENCRGVAVFFPFWNGQLRNRRLRPCSKESTLSFCHETRITVHGSPSLSRVRVRIPFFPTTRHSQTCGILSKPSHATDLHSRPHAHLRGLRPLRPLRPLPERLSHVPPVESRSRFAPRPHPPDDPRLSE